MGSTLRPKYILFGYMGPQGWSFSFTIDLKIDPNRNLANDESIYLPIYLPLDRYMYLSIYPAIYLYIHLHNSACI